MRYSNSPDSAYTRSSWIFIGLLLLFSFLLAACDSDAGDSSSTDGDTDGNGPPIGCTHGSVICIGHWISFCDDGTWVQLTNCQEQGKGCSRGECTLMGDEDPKPTDGDKTDGDIIDGDVDEEQVIEWDPADDPDVDPDGDPDNDEDEEEAYPCDCGPIVDDCCDGCYTISGACQPSDPHATVGLCQGMDCLIVECEGGWTASLEECIPDLADGDEDLDPEPDPDIEPDLDPEPEQEPEPEIEADEQEQEIPLSGSNCVWPPVYTRVVQFLEIGDFSKVVWAPDGSYALLIGGYDSLYRYDPDAETALSAVAEGGTEYWEDIEFSADGSFALIGGGSTGSSPVPKLYVYTEAGGLSAISDITGTASGKMVGTSIIRDIAIREGTEQFTLLSDNNGSNMIAYINQIAPNFEVDGTHQWEYSGGVNISQGARSIDWGTYFNLPIAIGCSNYINLITYYPSLPPADRLSVESTSTGNLKKVIFAPDGQVAWLFGWSGNLAVAWNGVLQDSYSDMHHFGSWSMSDFTHSPDGHWKFFVGKNGNAWMSDSPWWPIDDAKFYDSDIAGWDAAPWQGTSSDYLNSIAWRPGTCEGLIVGDAPSGKGEKISLGLIAKFEMLDASAN